MPCARKILSALAPPRVPQAARGQRSRAPLSFYQRRATANGSFDAGIESALQFILASPEFLFRFEPDPARSRRRRASISSSDLALASRLSFFLWSSSPDDRAADSGQPGQTAEITPLLEQQVKRMLADPRADALVDNFAEQWLFLRNLKNFAPDLDDFPDFDDNLRQAMQQETELFFESIMHEDRNVIDLLNADYTFVNERLARHYGIPNIYGSQFRRVTLDRSDAPRPAGSGQHSHCDLVSQPDFSRAARQVDSDQSSWASRRRRRRRMFRAEGERRRSQPKSLRERMEAASRQSRLRGLPQGDGPDWLRAGELRRRRPLAEPMTAARIDPSGTLVQRRTGRRPGGLRQMLASRPEVFVGVMTEKLLTYALGRGVEYYDMPAVRKIVRDAARSRLPVFVACSGHREEYALSR